MGKDSVLEEIKKFFSSRHDKEDARKMKRLAMHHRIRLGEKRKLFCGKCYSMNLKVKSIKRGIKTIECRDCKNVMRWKIKTFKF